MPATGALTHLVDFAIEGAGGEPIIQEHPRWGVLSLETRLRGVIKMLQLLEVSMQRVAYSSCDRDGISVFAMAPDSSRDWASTRELVETRVELASASWEYRELFKVIAKEMLDGMSDRFAIQPWRYGYGTYGDIYFDAGTGRVTVDHKIAVSDDDDDSDLDIAMEIRFI